MTKSRKVRRESGRKYNKFYNPEQGQYNKQYWDDWTKERDGHRNINKDNTKIQPKHLSKERCGDLKKVTFNSKIKRLLLRRKSMRRRKS